MKLFREFPRNVGTLTFSTIEIPRGLLCELFNRNESFVTRLAVINHCIKLNYWKPAAINYTIEPNLAAVKGDEINSTGRWRLHSQTKFQLSVSEMTLNYQTIYSYDAFKRCHEQ